MKKLLAIGIMSGTSLDGLDASLVSIQSGVDGPHIKRIGQAHLPYSKSFKEELRKLTSKNELREGASAGLRWSDEASKLVKSLLVKSRKRSRDVHVIGAHGQTVVHLPSYGISIQLGDLSRLAIATGIPVVGNFRTADLAAGGQGAPLVPHAHRFLFGQKGKTNAVQNLGGIGNVTVLSGQRVIKAYDTGPGNIWIDTALRMRSGGRLSFDRDGALARKGLIHPPLLRKLLAHPFFRKAPPKSAGWEEFGPSYVQRFMPMIRRLSLTDVAATMTMATVESLARSYERFVLPRQPLDQLILCGGGARNSFLSQSISRRFTPIRVVASDTIGVPAQEVEAISFAILAYQTMLGVPNNEPAATGAAFPVICGQIAFPAAVARLRR